MWVELDTINGKSLNFGLKLDLTDQLSNDITNSEADC